MKDEPFDINNNRKISKKNLYFGILGLFLILGVSYALIFYMEEFRGSELNLITDLVTIDISEDGNVQMDNATGQKDSEGLKNSKTTFSIKNDNNIGIKVVISMVVNPSSTISSNDIRSGVLDVSGNVLNVQNLGENDNKVYEFYLDKGEDVILYSTLWLDYYYEGLNKTFSGTYKVEVSNIDEYGYMYLSHLVGKNKGLYAINEDGTLNNGTGNIKEYRYSGLDPHNYVMFNDELWRIIGVVDGNIKIVKDTNLSASAFGSNNTYQGSTIETVLNDYYNSINEEEREYIAKKKYNIGAVNVDDTYTSLLSNEKTATYETYIGLINASDYLYSGPTNYYTNVLNYSSLGNNSWLRGTYSTINPIVGSTTNILIIRNKIPTGVLSTYSYEVKPCVYLRKDVSIVAGNGTQEKPYELAIINKTINNQVSLVSVVKSKVGTQGLVPINTSGTIASGSDTIREYRYTGSSKYCTYISQMGNEVSMDVDTPYCPNAQNSNMTYIHSVERTGSTTGISPNQTIPLDGEVDNYIWFNNEMWRIIGIFNETTASGSTEQLVKIIKEVPLLNEEVPDTYTYNGVSMTIGTNGTLYKNIKWNPSNYFSQTNTNDWTNSSLQYYLNDETSGSNSYYNSIGSTYQSMIETVQYHLGSVSDGNANSIYNMERGSATSGNQATWLGKIGMMYASDYLYAADSSNWTKSTASGGMLGYVTTGHTFHNWLNDNNRYIEWMLTVVGSDSTKYIRPYGDFWGSYVTDGAYAVSPVLYLKADVVYKSGDGSETNPYQVTMEDNSLSTITYNLNGGTGNIPANKAITGVTKIVPIKSGYEFLGWSTNPDAEEAEYTSGSEYTGSSVTLYAVWRASRYLYEEAETSLASYLLADDGDARIVSGSNEQLTNNYVWYSGKLWRIVALNNDGSIKLVTQDNITTIHWNADTTYSGSWIYQWLNEDFKDTLYNYENLLVTNYQWNATQNEESTKPANTTMVEGAVGLLNYYEYVQSYSNLGTDSTAYGAGYLNNGYYWWLITSYSSSYVWGVNSNGNANYYNPSSYLSGVRPSINLKSNIQIGGGEGTKTNPYTIVGDISEPYENELINERVSGEYVTFDNELYRIVEVENNITKITKADYIRDGSDTVVTKYLSSTYLYGASGNTQNDNYWDYYLNNTWYNSISTNYKNMLVSGTWYLGTVSNSTTSVSNNYKNAICATSNTTETTKLCTRTSAVYNGYVGLGRIGEMFTSQIGEGYIPSFTIWTITPYSSSYVWLVLNPGTAYCRNPSSHLSGARPSVNLKSTIKITGGLGTKESPFVISE